MAPERVIPDSDDDSSVIDLSPGKRHPAQEYSRTPSPPEPGDAISLDAENAATLDASSGSTELMIKDLQSAQRLLAEPTPQHLAPPRLEWNSSYSPTIATTSRGQTTMSMLENQRNGLSTLERTKPLKMYASRKTSEPTLWTEEEEEEQERLSPLRKKRRLHSASDDKPEDLVSNGDPFVLQSSAEVRVGNVTKRPAESKRGFFKAFAGQNGDAGDECLPHDNTVEVLHGDAAEPGRDGHGIAGGDYRSTVPQNLQETSTSPMLGGLLETAGPSMGSADPGLESRAEHSAQSVQYSTGDFVTAEPRLDSTPDTNALLHDLWGKPSNETSTVVIGSDERCNSQLADPGLIVENFSNLQSTPGFGDDQNSITERTPVRSKSVKDDLSVSSATKSPDVGGSQLNWHSKASFSPKDSPVAPTSSDNLMLPPAVKANNAKNTSKRGRKPKVVVDDESDGLHDEERTATSESKNRRSRSRSGVSPGPKSNALNDYPRQASDSNSDEVAIDLPREQYKPRPSRSRSGIGTEEPNQDEPLSTPLEVESKNSHSCSKNNASSEPSFELAESSPKKACGPDSDEIAVGLPKEQYKPRPSRSRGGKVAHELMSLDEVKPKKRLKRGITTGRILKKIVDSEDEDDVIYVEERPKKDVDQKADFEKVKQELSNDFEQADTTKSGDGSKKLVEVVMPRHLDKDAASEDTGGIGSVEQTNTGPKKRGRKPKQTIEAVEAVEAAEILEPLKEPPTSEASEAIEMDASKSAAPKKRGRKRKVTMETIQESDVEMEAKDDQVEKTTEVGQTITPEPAILEPKKRGRKRKKTADAPPTDEPIKNVDATCVEGDENPIISQSRLSNALIEKDSNATTRPRDKTNGDDCMDQDRPQTTQEKDKEVADYDDDDDDDDEDEIKTPQISSPQPTTPQKPSRCREGTDSGEVSGGGGASTMMETETETETATATSPDSSTTTKKGPTKHSPLGKAKVPFRVGLSRRARIEPLLKRSLRGRGQ